MPAADAMLVDFSDSDWHFGLDGAIEMANAYPHTPRCSTTGAAWTPLTSAHLLDETTSLVGKQIGRIRSRGESAATHGRTRCARPHGPRCARPHGPRRLLLIVDDIEAAPEELIGRGVDVSEIWHTEPGKGKVPGTDPERRSYLSRASFTDPDGNSWQLQEVTERLPGRV